MTNEWDSKVPRPVASEMRLPNGTILQKWNEEEIEFYIEGDFACSIWINALGALCGYIGIPSFHPWYEMEIDDIPINVHFGLTFGQHELEMRDSSGEYHPHRTEMDIYWIGFDCAHFSDAVPAFVLLHDNNYPIEIEQYKDVEYVKKEITNMVTQAAAVYQEAVNAVNASDKI